MRWPFRRKLPQWPLLSKDETRKRSRILVIDDAEFYYLELFRRDGYTVEQWRDVTDLSKLESGYYDVVLLDIHGVGLAESKDQGVGILRHLKRASPAQLLVAYSNADWPLKYKEFFDLADATLDKRADYVDFKRMLDTLLTKRFSLDFYVQRIVSIAAPSDGDTQRIQAAAQRAILTKDTSHLKRALASSTDSQDQTNMALQVAQVAIGILQLIAAL